MPGEKLGGLGQSASPKFDWRLPRHFFKDSREMLDGDKPAIASDVTNRKVGTGKQSFCVVYADFGQELMNRAARFAAEKRG